MQHHGDPTRLIDFTRDPYVSLFFAAESSDEIDSRLFAVAEHIPDVPNDKL